MTRSRRIQGQGLLVVLLGAFALATPKAAEARSTIFCYGYCSDALFDTQCPIWQSPQCFLDNWNCPQEAPWRAYCQEDS